MKLSFLGAIGLLACSAVQAQQYSPSEGDGRDRGRATTQWHGTSRVGGEHDDRRHQPMRAGSQSRPDNWNSDGAPRPPRMWRGRGSAWPKHYKACRQHYHSYDFRTDTIGVNGRRRRCVL